MVLKYVTDLLNEKVDINHLDSMIQKANYWEDGIEQLQNDEKNHRVCYVLAFYFASPFFPKPPFRKPSFPKYIFRIELFCK
jgi:hypothetical protein